MLNDAEKEALYDAAARAEKTPTGAPLTALMDSIRRGHVAGLRAVEAAVRADERKVQIEKDAVIAAETEESVRGPLTYSVIAVAIRAQLDR